MKPAVFEKYESNVRSYCRKYPVVFTKAKGSLLYDQDDREYIDFLCGAGSCNYGHNNGYIKGKVVDYLAGDGLIHGLDMYSEAKGEFIETLENLILKPRGFDYKVLFPGPTGTNAVEAALKIARKAKGRSNIFCLMGGFHGMSLGALELTSERVARDACGVALGNATHIPHPSMMPEFDTIAYMDMLITNDHSGVDKPAALIVETVQGEGGINILSAEWLRAARALCDKHDMLLICDEIQSGCGRTGGFFSFERAGIQPDIVVMAKSIGGIGMPCAITLVKPEYDVLVPGEHNGTFRGFQLAFVAGKAALEFLTSEHMEAEAKRKEAVIRKYLEEHLPLIASNITCRGLGVMWGIDFGAYSPKVAFNIRKGCFEHGVILELCGREDTVVKLMPAITTPDDVLMKGLEVVNQVMIDVVSHPLA
ncbi:MAG: aspartate aminotransferase family protein [Methanocorpusculum sp.]|nr:aspartate aminotransferase family protein [Methanocorpusculum sp.]